MRSLLWWTSERWVCVGGGAAMGRKFCSGLAEVGGVEGGRGGAFAHTAMVDIVEVVCLYGVALLKLNAWWWDLRG